VGSNGRGPYVWLPDQTAPDEIATVLGSKTAGLLLLPPSWTLPYFVLTTAAWESWAAHELEPGWLRVAIGTLGLDHAIAAVLSGHHVIVRSSGQSETMEERGQLTSTVSEPDLSEIERAAEESWSWAQDRRPNEPLALIVQQWRQPTLLGHLSNERRVSERHDSWLIESMSPDGNTTASLRVYPLRSGAEAEDPLVAQTSGEIARQLRRVAGRHLDRSGRRHFEWMWDGGRVWVVQCDFEKTPRGRPPGSDWQHQKARKVSTLSVFINALDATGPWNKTRCVRDFSELGLPTADLYVLEDHGALDELSRGSVPVPGISDIRLLSELPVVVRTDTAPGVLDGMDVLLPRTETCVDPEQVLTFLRTATTAFLELGLSVGEFCFLIHRFIPARSGSYSIAAPRQRRVRVDGIWGVPDGLLYLAHDSFEVDAKGAQNGESSAASQTSLTSHGTGPGRRGLPAPTGTGARVSVTRN